MEYSSNDILNSEYNDDDAIVEQFEKMFKGINQMVNIMTMDEYIYYSNDDDDDLNDGNTFLEVSQDEKIYGIKVKIDRDKTPKGINNVTIKEAKVLLQRVGWKIVSVIRKIVVSKDVSIFVSYQLYNSKHYVVLSKFSWQSKPRNFALPLSTAAFVANRIKEAYDKKDRVSNIVEANGWELLKQYGRVLTHPENCVAVSHQKYKKKDYIVITKYDWHKKPRTFAFLITSANEIRDVLIMAYTRGKRNAGKIYMSYFN